jgi:hypothetical protein
MTKHSKEPFGWNYKPAEKYCGLIFLREKYYSDWKNKLNKTDYKPDEQAEACPSFLTFDLIDEE